MAKANAIGIDLGTANTCAAIFKHGEVEILENGSDNLFTPSYVAFSDKECTVGDAAKNRIASNPSNTIYEIHRLLCLKTSDPEVQSALCRIPFRVISGETDFAEVEVQYKGETITFKPEEILSVLLRNIKENAEKVVGKPVQDVVITIPSNFNYQQRQAIKDAATIADLNVLRLMPSTAATAFAYGFNNNFICEQNVVVVDLGGGTLNVAVVTMEDNIFEVKSYACGYVCGKEIDNLLINYFISEIKCKHGKDVTSNPRAFCLLRSACESAKCTLSSEIEATIHIDSLFDGIDFCSKITRTKFEELCADLFRGPSDTVESALRIARMNREEIHEILLVGGSTRIPKIQKLLSQCFSGPILNKSLHPYESAACGAAIQAAVLSGNRSEVLLLDAAPFSYGIETVEGKFHPIIARCSTIPTKSSQTVTTSFDNQSKIVLQVFEGSHTKDNNFLGKFEFGDIPSAKAGIPKIEVIFDVDAGNNLTVFAEEKLTGKIVYGNFIFNESENHEKENDKIWSPVVVEN